jgi:hypothetical protein
VAKPKNGTLGRKVKMSQPIAIPWDLEIALVGAKVVKGPAVPKMEVMEKWIVGGGRDLEISHDRDAGLTVATLICPGADGPMRYEGSDVTMALATANAIHEYIKAQPKPDPEGKDLPLFRGNGGVASVAEIELEREAKDDGDKDEAPDEDGPKDLEAQLDDALAVADAPADVVAAEEPAVRDWRFLFMVDPTDIKLWQADTPSDDEFLVVDFDEGDAANDRGWYIAPGYRYDHKAGEIREELDGGETELVWSRLEASTAAPVAD